MAWTEIHPIKLTLRKALDYICNPDKTDGKLLISTFGCDAETADIEFQYTNGRAVGKKGTNFAHHNFQLVIRLAGEDSVLSIGDLI